MKPNGQWIRKGQPDPSDAYVVPELTSLSVGFMQDAAKAFVAGSFFPSVPIELQNGKYPVYPRGYFWRDDMAKRADGASSPESGFAIKYQDAATEVWSWRTNIGPQLRANAKNHNLDQAAASLCAQKALINREVQWMANYFVTGVWGTEYTGADNTPEDAGEVLPWTDEDADPIAQIDAGILTQKRKVGGMYAPNKALFGASLWNTFKNHPNVLARINGGATTGTPARMTLELAAGLIGVDEIRIADAVKTTSADANDDGATDTFDFIGADDQLLLVYAAPSPGLLTPSAGYTFEWNGYTGAGANGSRMSNWYDQDTKGQIYEIEQAYDQAVVASEMGIMFIDMLTAAA